MWFDAAKKKNKPIFSKKNIKFMYLPPSKSLCFHIYAYLFIYFCLFEGLAGNYWMVCDKTW